MSEQGRTIVHLVHGTWPYGPFAKQAPPGQPAWFEQGSDFRCGVAKWLIDEVEFADLPWSGRNAVEDRFAAGMALREEITKLARAEPAIRQIVIAHSHGGNAAVAALEMAAWPEGHPPVAALICLSTPFVYLTPAGKAARGLFPACVATLISAAAAIGLAKIGASLATFLVSILLIGLIVVPGLRYLQENWVPADKVHYLLKRLGSAPPTFIIRSTRDEASLAIGLAQAIQSAQALLLGFLASPGSLTRSLALLVPVVLLWTAALMLVPGLAALLASIGPFKAGLVVAALDAAPFAALYLIAYLILALATGFLDPRLWGSTHIIEAEPVPSDKSCEFKCYGDVESVLREVGVALGASVPPGAQTTPPGLRHSVYNIAAVQFDIALLINDVLLDQVPTLSLAERNRRAEASRRARARRSRANPPSR